MTEWGEFIGECQTSWQPDGRKMMLLQQFIFRDKRPFDWTVPKETMIDGASIPPALWSIIGSPYTGLYRNASVVHDWYCCVKTESHKDVHRMFFNGMRASGVGEFFAKMLYLGVLIGGPRWTDMDVHNNRLHGRGSKMIDPTGPQIAPQERQVPSNHSLEAKSIIAGHPALGSPDFSTVVSYAQDCLPTGRYVMFESFAPANMETLKIWAQAHVGLLNYATKPESRPGTNDKNVLRLSSEIQTHLQIQNQDKAVPATELFRESSTSDIADYGTVGIHLPTDRLLAIMRENSTASPEDIELAVEMATAPVELALAVAPAVVQSSNLGFETTLLTEFSEQPQQPMVLRPDIVGILDDTAAAWVKAHPEGGIAG